MKWIPPRQAEKISNILIIVGAIIGFFGMFLNQSIPGVLGILVLVISVVIRLSFFRCPNCGKYLGGGRGEKCPCCGREINQ